MQLPAARVTRYGIRLNSGGSGRYRGGDGIVREVELLTDAEVTIVSERRHTAPCGLSGGGGWIVWKKSSVEERQKRKSGGANFMDIYEKEMRLS